MKRNLKQEWQEILELSEKEESLRRWLEAREIAFRAGDDTKEYTNTIRRVYRQLTLKD